MVMTRRALVLGAGRHAAIAWETGVIAGLAESGIDLRHSEMFIGTSAGSIVGVQITSGLALENLFRKQAYPDPENEPATRVDFNQWRTAFMSARQGPGGTTEILERFGRLGRTTSTEPESERRKVVASCPETDAEIALRRSSVRARSAPPKVLLVAGPRDVTLRRRAEQLLVVPTGV
jgi:NTE family protein